jgi:hypothetical protein
VYDVSTTGPRQNREPPRVSFEHVFGLVVGPG